jgi:hypothetical protein
MAKKSDSGKTAAIREMLDRGLSKPAEVAAAVKEHYGIEVHPNYVSKIKSTSRTSGKKGTRPKRAAASSKPVVQEQPVSQKGRDRQGQALAAAIEFVRKVGSLQAAKEALATIEEIQQL